MWKRGAPLFTHPPLGSHVAVRDGRSLALPTHCTAGDDHRHRGWHRRDQDPARARRVFQMGWLGTSRGRRRMASSLLVAAVVLVVCLTMLLVATFPRLPTWVAVCVCVFVGSTISGPVVDAPAVLCGWHAVENVQARPRCAETGLIDRSSTNPVDAHGRSAALEREGEEHGGRPL